MNFDNSTSDNKSYVLPKYIVHFDDELATKHRPIIYSHECLSGDPEAVYYRIVSYGDTGKICIQYFYYWPYQSCMMACVPVLIYGKTQSVAIIQHLLRILLMAKVILQVWYMSMAIR